MWSHHTFSSQSLISPRENESNPKTALLFRDEPDQDDQRPAPEDIRPSVRRRYSYTSSKTAAEEVLNRISTSAREVGITVNNQKTKRIALNEDAVIAIHLDNEELGLNLDANAGAIPKVGRRIRKTATKHPERRLLTAYNQRGVMSRPSSPERSSQRQTLEAHWQLCSS